jgi:hypothetical protein
MNNSKKNIIRCTNVLVFNNKWQILMWIKKTWFGAWKCVFVWWKIEKWETIEECAIRELEEETWIKLNVSDIYKKWKNLDLYEEDEDSDWECNIVCSYNYKWEPQETEEIKPFWCDINGIPYEKMWEETPIWLPKILNWENVDYQFYFDKKQKLIKDYENSKEI